MAPAPTPKPPEPSPILAAAEPLAPTTIGGNLRPERKDRHKCRRAPSCCANQVPRSSLTMVWAGRTHLVRPPISREQRARPAQPVYRLSSPERNTHAHWSPSCVSPGNGETPMGAFEYEVSTDVSRQTRSIASARAVLPPLPSVRLVCRQGGAGRDESLPLGSRRAHPAQVK